jgi:iduronate 2-sulfatase
VRLKNAAFTQHPRPAYFDRQPPRVPKVMGMSVRTEAVRYTEWRDWGSGAVVGAELYDAKGDVGETRNVIADAAWKDRLAEARRHLATQFGPR